jgi:hypothetical protein
VREIAQLWEIQLVFIPPGCTDKLQPLDRRILGVLKSYARQLWRKQYRESRSVKTIRSMMAANSCKAWGRITAGLIQEAWDIYGEEDWGSLFAWDTSIDDDDLVRDESVEPLWLPHRQWINQTQDFQWSDVLGRRFGQLSSPEFVCHSRVLRFFPFRK